MITTRIIYFTNDASCDINNVEIDPPPNQSAVNPPSVCCTPCHSSMCKYRKSDVPSGTSLFSLKNYNHLQINPSVCPVGSHLPQGELTAGQERAVWTVTQRRLFCLEKQIASSINKWSHRKGRSGWVYQPLASWGI